MYLGNDNARNKIELDAADLLTHGVILGRTLLGQ